MSNPTTEVAVPSDNPEGLEDLDDSDRTLPIYRASARDGGYVDPNTKEVFASFNAILLGVVKQRSLWPTEMSEEGEGPICRSSEHKTGIPDADKFLATDTSNVTPVSVSGFAAEQVRAAAAENGTPLSCADCGLAAWDSHPKSGAPWCTEQYTLPFLRIDDEGQAHPGIITFQRTGLKAVKSYLDGFRNAKKPLYTAITCVTANMNTRGSNDWLTPSFKRIGDSDHSLRPQYSEMLSSVSGFLRTPRRPRNAETAESGLQPAGPATGVVETSATDEPPKPPKRAAPATASAAPAPATTAPTVEPPPSATTDADWGDEEPF